MTPIAIHTIWPNAVSIIVACVVCWLASRAWTFTWNANVRNATVQQARSAAQNLWSVLRRWQVVALFLLLLIALSLCGLFRALAGISALPMPPASAAAILSHAASAVVNTVLLVAWMPYLRHLEHRCRDLQAKLDNG